MRKNKKGFTLVELVIVIAVIAILASVLLPTFAGILERARNNSKLQKATSVRDELISAESDLPNDIVGYVVNIEDKYYEIQSDLSLKELNLTSEEASLNYTQITTKSSLDAVILVPDDKNYQFTETLLSTYKRVDLNNDGTTTENPNGDYILFGYYPKTIKADNVKIGINKDGEYFIGSDGCRYKQVVADIDYVLPFTNGKEVVDGETYYFKVEPILWKILKQENNKALIYSCNVLTSFGEWGEYNCESYITSNVRSGLNEMYSTIFTESEKQKILPTILDLSSDVDTIVSSTNSNTIEDYLFLLSKTELKDTTYFPTEESRQKQLTDYAKTQHTYNTEDYNQSTLYWTRTIDDWDYEDVYYVSRGGSVLSMDKGFVYLGVVPALTINLG